MDVHCSLHHSVWKPRPSSEAGTVTVENMGLGGVMVRLSGMADSETATDDAGQYSFTGLRAGTYAVEISGSTRTK